jgi:hypothetical protein
MVLWMAQARRKVLMWDPTLQKKERQKKRHKREQIAVCVDGYADCVCVG